jgi:hypothetical protein
VTPGRATVCSPPAHGLIRPDALGATAPNVLGHLRHRLQLQRPEELRMVSSEVQLRRLIELLLGIADE